MSIVIITNGNDPQVPYMIRLHESLRDKFRGNYNGKFYAFSDALSRRSVACLKRFKVPLHLFSKDKIEKWKRNIPSDHPLGKVAKFWFIRDAIEQFRGSHDRLIYLDPDILVQQPIRMIIGRIVPDKVLMSGQQKPMLSYIGGPVKRILRAVVNGDLDARSLTAFEPEINTGFMAGHMDCIHELTSDYIGFVTSHIFRKYARHDSGQINAWHDQDYFRAYLRVRGANALKLLGNDCIIHLCNGAHDEVWHKPDSLTLRLNADKTAPCLIHFAGQSDSRFKIFDDYFDFDKITEDRFRLNIINKRLAQYGLQLKKARERARLAVSAFISEDKMHRLQQMRSRPRIQLIQWDDNMGGLWNLPKKEFIGLDILLTDIIRNHFGAKQIKILQLGIGRSTLANRIFAIMPGEPHYDGVDAFLDREGDFVKAQKIFQSKNQRLWRQNPFDYLRRTPAKSKYDAIFIGGNALKDKLDDLLELSIERVKPGGLMIVPDYSNSDHPTITRDFNKFVGHNKHRIKRLGYRRREFQSKLHSAPMMSSIVYFEVNGKQI